MRVIITGGSRGIGAECVREFSSRGDKVAFIYKSSDTAAKELAAETGAVAIKADLSANGEATAAVDAAVLALGGVDVLVNNAGVSKIGLFTDLTEKEVRELISCDLESAMLTSKAAIPTMVRQHKGYIVNVSSMWGVTGASCEVVYSAAKAGLIGFTKALAKELGPSGITVNCVAPGVIATEMNSSLDRETLAELCDETPLGRIGTVRDVAEAVLFLASDKASFITGEILNVNGGFVI